MGLKKQRKWMNQETGWYMDWLLENWKPFFAKYEILFNDLTYFGRGAK
jgi:hypothetical protein